MKKFLQWSGAGIVILLLVFLGMQIYTSQVYCKNSIVPLHGENGIEETFYNPIAESCYVVINTSSAKRSDPLGIIASDCKDGEFCLNSQTYAGVDVTVLYEIKNNKFIDKGDYHPTKLKTLLNKLGFGPIGQQQYKGQASTTPERSSQQIKDRSAGKTGFYPNDAN